MDRIPIELDTFHHIYNRGTEKRLIFLDDADRKLFVRFFYLLNDQKIISPSRLGPQQDDSHSNRDKLVYMVAFCLMDNHFHLVLYEKTEGGIGKFMQRLGTAYVRYFNEKYERSGTLFQGKYKSRYISDEAYLMGVIDYTHLNPITHKRGGEKIHSREVKDLEQLDLYSWSSYQNYCGKPIYENILDKEILHDHLELPKNYKKWLQTEHDFSGIEDLMID